MDNYKKMLKIRSIILIVFCIVVLGVLVFQLSKTDLKYSFKGGKEINNIVELENTKEGTYVNLKVSRAYETEYLYYEDDKQVGKFIDIEMNGKVLIAILDTKTAEKVLNNMDGKEQYIEGKLIKYTEENMVDGYNKIKQNYLEDFGGELTEDEIMEMFTRLQLLNYGIKRPNIVVSILLIFATFFIFTSIIILIIRLIFSNEGNLEKVKINGRIRKDFTKD